MKAFAIAMIVVAGASAIAQALHPFNESGDRVVTRATDGFNVAANIAMAAWGASVVWWPT